MAPKYKLTYFNLRGRCEHIRYIFAAAEVPFEDNRIAPENWPELKPKTPFGALPMLEVNGKTIAQSGTIARYVARECKLAGKDSLDAALADQVGEVALEIREKYLVPLGNEKDEAKKAETVKKMIDETFPKMFKDLTNILGDNSFFVDNKLTWADLMVYAVLEMVEMVNVNFNASIDAFPTLRALQKRISEQPGIAKYLKERPVTPY